MPSRMLAILLATCLGLALPAAAEHSHDHPAPASVHLDHGKKWATDAPLRSAMNTLRAEMAAAQPDIRRHRLSPARYAALASSVEREVAHMTEQCQLTPQADEQLHLVIAGLLAGAEAMAGKAPATSRHAGALWVINALDQYGAHFDHPEFPPLSR